MKFRLLVIVFLLITIFPIPVFAQQCSTSCIFYDPGTNTCRNGHCLDMSKSCSNSINCGYVNGCTDSVATCPAPSSRCVKTCIYFDPGTNSCRQGHCFDPTKDCADSVNCGYVDVCQKQGAAPTATCPTPAPSPPAPTLAPTPTAGPPFDVGLPPSGLAQIEQLFVNVVAVAVILGFMALFVFLVWAGFKYLTSGGEPKAIHSAHQTVTWALLGVLFLAIAWLVLRLIEAFTNIPVTLFDIQILNR